VRISFDSDVDGLTFVVSDRAVARTVEAGEGRLVDLDADGNVVAIEILGASHGIQLQDLAESYDLEDLFNELRASVKQARSGLQEDARLREVLTAH
jgi:uncharacterized protein YuzE